MNLRPNRRKPPEMVLIPLLDIVLVLLIFFMVSTTFKDPDASRLHITLPEAEGTAVPDQEPEELRIAIDAAGHFYVNDLAVVDQEPRTLVRAITGALDERQDRPVLIQADAQTPHQAVMTALDAAAELGLVRISFSATRAPDAAQTQAPGGAR
jgi:biopolymer transport protein ExbD